MKSYSKLFVVPSVLLMSAAGCMHLEQQDSGTAGLSGTDRFAPQLATPVQLGAGRTLRTVDGAVGSGDSDDHTRDSPDILAAHDSVENANADLSAAQIQDDYLRAVQTIGRRSLPFFPVFAVRPW